MNLSNQAIKQIGKSQRAICLWILFVICLYIISFLFYPPLSNLSLIGPFIVLPSVWKMSKSMGNETASTIMLCVGVLIPLVSIIILVVMSSQATSILKQAGLHVGLLGASKDELDKLN